MAARAPASRRYCKLPAPWTRTRTSFSAACTSSGLLCPTSTASSIRSKISGSWIKSLPATAPVSPPSCACRRLSAKAIFTPEPARVSICPSLFENFLLVQVVGRLQPLLHLAVDLFRSGNCNAVHDPVFFSEVGLHYRHAGMYSIQRTGSRCFCTWQGKFRSPILHRRISPPKPLRLFVIPDALEHRPDHQRQRHRGIIEDFRKPPSFFRRPELSPGNGFRVSAAADAAPMDRLRANAHAVAVALQRNFFVAAPRQQFPIPSKLLRPLATHSSAHRKTPHPPHHPH